MNEKLISACGGKHNIFFAYQHQIDSLPLSCMLSKIFMMSKFQWQVDGMSMKGLKFLLEIAFQNIEKPDDFELFPNLNSKCTSSKGGPYGC